MPPYQGPTHRSPVLEPLLAGVISVIAMDSSPMRDGRTGAPQALVGSPMSGAASGAVAE